ncbi:MAG: hypothetical protein HS116_18285 [Planctomycetes bacterium]|nr:hypothetical protein [Planctomycetota bacterium]
MNLTARQHALVKLFNEPLPGRQVRIDCIAIDDASFGITTALRHAQAKNPALLYAPADRPGAAVRLMSEVTGTTGQGIAARLWRIVDWLRRSQKRGAPTLIFDDAHKLDWHAVETLIYTAEWCADQQGIPLRLVFLFGRLPVYSTVKRASEPRFRGFFCESGETPNLAFRRTRLRAHCWQLTLKGLSHVKPPKEFSRDAEDAPLLAVAS